MDPEELLNSFQGVSISDDGSKEEIGGPSSENRDDHDNIKYSEDQTTTARQSTVSILPPPMTPLRPRLNHAARNESGPPSSPLAIITSTPNIHEQNGKCCIEITCSVCLSPLPYKMKGRNRGIVETKCKVSCLTTPLRIENTSFRSLASD
jgi:hypothetical protein